MTALAEKRINVQTLMQDQVHGGIIAHMGIVADDIVFEGGYLEVLAAGHVQPAGVGSSLQGAGLALETVSNAGGSASDKFVQVLIGCFVEDAITATIANIGDPVYASDDQTLTVTAGTSALMGWLVQFTGTNRGIVKLKYPGQPLT